MIRDATPADAGAIAAIYNHAVEHTTAVWNEVTVDAANRLRWMEDRQGAGFAVLVAVEGDVIAGYGAYGAFRAFDGYRLTVEHSVYVAPDAQGRGLGRAILSALMDRAARAGFHAMIGAIESGNTGSLALHRALGFAEVGRLPQVGQKFGRWLDLTLMQKLLDERARP